MRNPFVTYFPVPVQLIVDVIEQMGRDNIQIEFEWGSQRYTGELRRNGHLPKAMTDLEQIIGLEYIDGDTCG